MINISFLFNMINYPLQAYHIAMLNKNDLTW